MMFRAAAAHPSKDVHFYCSSEGNAGLACATTALTLGHNATIVVPLTARPLVMDRLRSLGASVVQHGRNWPEADAFLRQEFLTPTTPSPTFPVYVPPFNHPDVWSGAATLIDELTTQTPTDIPIDAIVCSVGGGGLLNGVMQGLEHHGKVLGRSGRPPSVLAVETVGADSLHSSVVAGKHVTLPGITSIATSLGATRVSDRSWEWATTRENLVSATVSDADAAMACVRFLQDARIMVEPACGATLAPAYNGDLRRRVGKGLDDEEWAARNVVLVVCGGSNAGLDALVGYKEMYGKECTFYP